MAKAVLGDKAVKPRISPKVQTSTGPPGVREVAGEQGVPAATAFRADPTARVEPAGLGAMAEPADRVTLRTATAVALAEPAVTGGPADNPGPAAAAVPAVRADPAEPAEPGAEGVTTQISTARPETAVTEVPVAMAVKAAILRCTAGSAVAVTVDRVDPVAPVVWPLAILVRTATRVQVVSEALAVPTE